jgi:hypothetical protein
LTTVDGRATPGALQDFSRLDANRDNLALPLSWGLENEPEAALAMVSGLGSYSVDRGHHTEARRWLQDLMAVSADAETAQMGLTLLIASQLDLSPTTLTRSSHFA